MKRRNFLQTPLLFAFGNAFASSAHSADNFIASSDSDVQEIQALLRNPHTAAQVGKKYLLDNPKLANRKKLRCAVGLHAQASSSAKSLFKAQQQLDFEAGNIHCLDGWVLSNAEVSLCALATITSIKS